MPVTKPYATAAAHYRDVARRHDELLRLVDEVRPKVRSIWISEMVCDDGETCLCLNIRHKSKIWEYSRQGGDTVLNRSFLADRLRLFLRDEVVAC
jgi:hypothetical protein